MPSPNPSSSLRAGSRPSGGVDTPRLLSAWRSARQQLLSDRNAQGFWVGELGSSAAATATAISALSIAEQHAATLARSGDDQEGEAAADRWNLAYQTDLSELICNSVRWLARQQNDDGGWGDAPHSASSLATTLLVLSAFRLTGVPAKFKDLEPRAEKYLKSQGGVAGLKKKYGPDKTLVAPILANAALAGVASWKQAPALPFEIAAISPAGLSRSWLGSSSSLVAPYALPALVAVGLAKHHHSPAANPIARLTRRLVAERCLAQLSQAQPDSGGFMESTPLTSFVVMTLASTGRADHPVVRRGVEFLLSTIRPDGSWSAGVNLATWNTAMAVRALDSGLDPIDSSWQDADSPPVEFDETIAWLLACQRNQPLRSRGAEPGGWSWTNLSGGVPDTEDTACVLLTLAAEWPRAGGEQRRRIALAVRCGLQWLLNLQNRGGGWPLFARGWSRQPLDRSASDLTANALRALNAWRKLDGWWMSQEAQHAGDSLAVFNQRIDAALAAGLSHLADQQADDGSWPLLGRGAETSRRQSNRVYSTARVLSALADFDLADKTIPQRGLKWLADQQHASGGWGADPSDDSAPIPCNVEATAAVVEALVSWSGSDATNCRPLDAGVRWLVEAVESGQVADIGPTSVHFTKLWRHERLSHTLFAASALGAVAGRRVASERQYSDHIGLRAAAV